MLGSEHSEAYHPGTKLCKEISKKKSKRNI